ncbi:MAG: metallophosphoesterase [Desulfobacteraceae bacterium]
MRILFVADIHAHHDHLAQSIEKTIEHDVDALIIGGDIVPHELPNAHALGLLDAQAMYIEGTLIPAFKRLKAAKAVSIYFDFGNDDFMANRPLLEPYQGDLFHLLHLQKYAIADGVDLIGYMMVPPTPFQRKDWEKPDASDVPYPSSSRVRLKGYATGSGQIEEVVLDLDEDPTIEEDLDRLEGTIQRPFIFVAHCPPHDTPLDMLSSGSHVGSISIRRFIEKWSRRNLLIASLHGHIHESPRVSGTTHTRINDALAVNPGQDVELQFALMELARQKGGAAIRLLDP